MTQPVNLKLPNSSCNCFVFHTPFCHLLFNIMTLTLLFVFVVCTLLLSANTFRLGRSSSQQPRLHNNKMKQLSMTNGEVDNLITKIRQATPPKSVVVIKYGGHAMENDEFKNLFCQDIATLCKVCKLFPINLHISIYL